MAWTSVRRLIVPIPGISRPKSSFNLASKDQHDRRMLLTCNFEQIVWRGLDQVAPVSAAAESRLHAAGDVRRFEKDSDDGGRGFGPINNPIAPGLEP
jgi:hypothetical protein